MGKVNERGKQGKRKGMSERVRRQKKEGKALRPGKPQTWGLPERKRR